MKIHYFFLLLLPTLALCQSTDQNYIKTTTYKGENGTLPVVNITYFDGLGRPIQQKAHGQSNTGKDIVTHIEYDAFGRPAKEYLPYTSSTPSLNFDPAALTEATSYYSSPSSSRNGNPNPVEATTNPYSEKQFEASPLNRVLQQAAPGNAWALGGANTIKMEYYANTSADNVRLLDATTTWDAAQGLYDIALTDRGFYSPGQLYKTITKDENWTSTANPVTNHTTEEFKDKEGRVVLKRTYNGIAHDTYYIYDIYGNLTYVLPPKATGTITPAILEGLCYQYKYDNRNRLAAKKLPGKQWEFMVYDRLDRLVATGPAKSPYAGGQGTLVTQYDVFGRVTATGWKSVTMSSASRGSLQLQLTGETDPFPLSQAEVLTRNYYDNYSFPGAPTAIPATIEGEPTATNVRGLATGSWTRVLTTGSATNAETAYTIYDHRYRPVRSYTTNYLGGYTQSDSKLDFEGKTRYTITTHKRVASDTELKTTEAFTYSPQGRLLTHTHQIGAGPVELLASNQYDELGQLIAKKVGGSDTSGNTGLQKVDYHYNIRGWLKSINNTDNLSSSGDPADLFSFKVNYNTPTIGQALFNGNIAETLWRTSSDNVLRQYTYQYDPLNRLLDAAYSKPGVSINNSYGENLSYDANGNIMTLTRYGQLDDNLVKRKIDNLTYNYIANSNRLASVGDAENDPNGFKGPTFPIVFVYGYDDNGNLTRDPNKDISLINYNHLNLPVRIISTVRSTTRLIDYIYNAKGEKVKMTYSGGSFGGGGNKDYLNGYQYENGVLQFFPTAEGYVKNAIVAGGSNRYSYVYNYTDHLGNIRLSYENNNNVLTVLEENNYYAFGLKHNGYNSVESWNPRNKYRYNNKEWQDELGLNVYDYGARNYDPALGRWMNIDPLAEMSRRFSPYAYALNNPVFFIDPDGMMARPPGDFINEKGRYLGNDGINDGKVYVVKTTEKSFPTGQSQDTPAAGITNKEKKATESFITANSGNTAAFQSNDIAYKNSVEIESSADTRQSMVDIVNQDNGRGGTSDSNNREYGGRVKRDGTVVEAPAGPIGNPAVDKNANITLTTFFEGQVTFHSHPSGVRVDGNITSSWAQPPSFIGADIQNSNNTREYVFGRGNGTVYIFNSTGVMATIPQQYFVTPKK